MRTQNLRKSYGLRDGFSALFVAAVVLLSAAGCNFTKAPSKQSSTSGPSLSAQIYYSDIQRGQKTLANVITHKLYRIASDTGGVTRYAPTEPITLDDSKFMFIEIEQPLELQSLNELSVSGEFEWEGIRHPLITGVVETQREAPDKSNIKITVNDISSVIGVGRNKFFTLHFEVKAVNSGTVNITLPVRLPPVSVEYSLHSLSDFLSQNNEVSRDFASQTINGEELTLIQVAKVTNNEDYPVKLQIGRVVAGEIRQTLQRRLGFTRGQIVFPKMFIGYSSSEPCNLNPFGSRPESHYWGDHLYLLPLTSSLGAEFEKTQRDASQNIVQTLRPKESAEIGLYSADSTLREWRLNGPLRVETGEPTVICYSNLKCGKNNGPPLYTCDRDFQVRPSIESVGPMVLSIHGIASKSTTLGLNGTASLIKASFFSDFKMTKTPPSYRIRVFKEKSELPWREGL